MLYPALRPLLFRLEPERAHGLSLSLLAKAPLPRVIPAQPALLTTLGGLRFASPVGLAAGFDKDGIAAHRLNAFGFGFAEIGTLTPLAQQGNPRPRLFRLVEDEAVINRMGFNNGGQVAAIARLKVRPRVQGFPLGINIGANKDAADRVADYVAGVKAMAPFADYLTLNISSPNTPGLRALQDKGALDALLSAVNDARTADGPPLWLKVAPDLTPADIDDIAALAIEHRLGALIVSNTTITRPALRSRHVSESGGLSGAPLHDLALERLRDFRRATGGAVPLVGVGGIATAAQAYARVRAGASLVQIYSALVYHGPGLPARINRDLAAFLARDGLASLSDAVGVDTQ